MKRILWLASVLGVFFVVPYLAAEEVFWAFRPIGRPAIPKVLCLERMRTPIDAFVSARLEDKGLSFSPEADKPTLVRRAYLDLLGLPPSPEEVDAFVADGRPDAYERLIDRLLASPHFGERWGRHWLDVVGYADTVGFDVDANLILVSDGKWRYRDYVIAAFSHDKPYNRFVTEQLAGDEMVDWRNAPRFTPEIRELLIATGYLRTVRDQTHEPESNIPLSYFGVLHDTVAMVGNSLLGLTLNCAQCHNHKFDPIPQKDYYQLMAAFTPAYNPQAWKPVYPWKPEIKDRALPNVAPAELAQIERDNRAIDAQAAKLNQQLADLRRPYQTRLRQARLQALPEPIRADTSAAVETPAAKRTDLQKYLAAKLEPLLRVTPEEVQAALSGADRSVAAQINEQIHGLEGRRRSFGKIQALYDVGPPPRTFLLKRGNLDRPDEEVQPGFLSALTEPDRPPKSSARPCGEVTSGRRIALAGWLTKPDSRASALLARVMVNRLWQHLFGQGIVTTPENFGHSGEPPTHPELLEWLSGEFVRIGWHVKPLLRLMMTSTTYRQASQQSTSPATSEKVDPSNRLLWRMRLRRLEAEVIRDELLAVGGQLDATMGGPPVRLRSLADGMVEIDEKALPALSARDRRSVYLLSRRAYNLSLLNVFDFPLIAVNCACRDVSAVPLQSLAMLNDGFVAEQAGHVADRVARAAGASREKAIARAFQVVLARQPNSVEWNICTELLDRRVAFFRSAGRPESEAHRLALIELCHTLLNTSEFLYVE
jgi:hypothetical protein